MQNSGEKIAVASDLFMVAIDRETGKIAGFLNGIATDEHQFKDDFFTDAKNHKADGRNIMLLGLDVLPEYRKQGLGRELVYNYCRREQARGRYRLRMCIWKHWKIPQNRAKNLLKLGVNRKRAYAAAYAGSRIARVCRGTAVSY